MNPPETLELLSMYAEPAERNKFLNNTLPINSISAFGSLSAGKVIFYQIT
jgi:hypothetical protein